MYDIRYKKNLLQAYEFTFPTCTYSKFFIRDFALIAISNFIGIHIKFYFHNISIALLMDGTECYVCKAATVIGRALVFPVRIRVQDYLCLSAK